MDRSKDVGHEAKDCFLTDEAGNAIALIEGGSKVRTLEENLHALYPGQPEKEDTSDETIPSGVEISNKETAGDRVNQLPLKEGAESDPCIFRPRNPHLTADLTTLHGQTDHSSRSFRPLFTYR